MTPEKGKLTASTSMRVLISTLFFIYTLLCSLPEANARKIKTKHSVPKKSGQVTKANASEYSDSIISLSSDSITFVKEILPSIHFYGFDKTVTSNLESFFITNGLDETISGIEINITYLDMKGRQLHKRKVCIDCGLPPGETERYDIKSWDTQKSFYFHRSVKPKRQATPFDVKIELISVTL